MLPREQRLSLKKDFQRVFTRGMSASNSLYTIRWAPNTTGASRFGFIISNKISKLATKRNTIRRRLRECVRRNGIPLVPSLDVVFLAKPTLLTAGYRDIEPVMRRSFEIIQTRHFTPPLRRAYRKP